MIWSLECERKERRERERKRGSAQVVWNTILMWCWPAYGSFFRSHVPMSHGQAIKWSLRSYRVYVCVCGCENHKWHVNTKQTTFHCWYWYLHLRADIQHVSNRIVSEINRFGYASDRSIETINFDVLPTSTHCTRHSWLLHCESTMGPSERNNTCETQLIRIGKPFTVRYNWNLK